ncbi:LuxR family transcriptional regulator [Mycobacterium sp. IS-1742]|uniref:helix-turn-helix transcriptional regulator n=1 Tax=Mycobacterium sp. IS-1742 TaxID=1772285 RepID=UPI00073FCE0D|nr:LuxR family transcriptional regulator [Mycobacterium sp. IS-1742]KUI27377.1 LuxR family transcriptional regulator [Mycobacterium sp. IS-1742]
MPLQLISRDAELSAVDSLLAAVPTGTSVLVLEGDAGIGKSTVWRAGIERARARGFQVLSAHPVASESAAAYSSLAELLTEVDAAVLDHLPAPQRLAIDRVLSHADDTGPGTDQRAVAAAVRSVVERLAQASPVLVAVDDMQWLDPPTAVVLASVARRCTGAIGFLVTVRAGDGDGTDLMLEPSRPERLHRAQVHPMSVGGLHAMINHQLGQSLTRPKMDWVYEVSAGNPFYALELARALNRDAADAGPPLPATLAELVRTRIAGLPDHTREVLLATACIASPTVDLVARAVGENVEWTVAALEEAERHGIVEINGYKVTFSHPLLARGVYVEASTDERRWMHGRLADIVDNPESRARHRALAGDGADEKTVKALDEAAESAHQRGAPAAAAELLDMARARGGDTPERALRAAACHFEAGDTVRARELLEYSISEMDPGELRATALHLLGLVRLWDNSSAEAGTLLERALAEPGVSPDRRVQMLVMLSFMEFNAGRVDRAVQRAEEAVAQASTLQRADLLSQARPMRALLRFLIGDGLDEAELAGVFDFDEPEDMPLAARPRTLHALLMLWTDRLDEAAEQFTAIAQHSIDRGDESERSFLDFHLGQVHIWRADLRAAERVAEDSVERALQSHGDLPLFIALIVRVMVSAHLGREEQTRRFAEQAFAVGERCQSSRLGVWVVTSLGLLEVSLGNHEAAVEVLGPAVEGWSAMPASTELITAPFLPDTAEALVGVGIFDDAERLVEALEDNGTRLDRPWMLAVGARCRAVLLAARGDLTGAITAGERALKEHERLSMPLELARTQLVVGRLQHRRRQYDSATATVSTALAAFDRIGAELWARQARAELAGLTGRQTAAGLADSERRFADLAAQGMTNREIAAALFVSEKTVEANLSRVYRRLGIRSRSELARVLNA